MITDIEYRRLKEEVEKVRQAVDRAKGALEQLNQRLKEEFNCKSIQEAELLLKTLKKETAEAQESFEKQYSNYVKKYEPGEGS